MRTSKSSRNTEKKPNSSTWTVVSFSRVESESARDVVMMFGAVQLIAVSAVFAFQRCVFGVACFRVIRSCVAKQMRLSTPHRAEGDHGTKDR
jgi:hypothetical protein